MTSYTVGNDDYFGSGTPNYTTYNTVHANDAGDTIYDYFNGPSGIYGGTGSDYISASGVSATSSVYLDGGTGADTIIGGGHFDVIFANGPDSIVGSTVSGALNEIYDLYAGFSTLVGGAAANNHFHISGGSDSITGGNVGDRYYISEFGSNTIKGGSGADQVFDSVGNNNINLGAGNDTVYAVGANNDIIIGTSGDKIIFVGNTSASHTVQVTGGSGNDTINASADQGVAYISPGTGSGLNIVTGGDLSNHIYGNNATGNLYERGGKGQDELIGGKGSNHFIATPGGDFITGGGASNAYLFNDLSAGNTHLNNFNTATDVIGINAQNFAGLYGGETLTLGYNLINGTAPVANTATFLYSGGGLYFDADGTGAASSPVQVAGLVNAPATLSPNNFYISATAF